jgi:hypothetical protein
LSLADPVVEGTKEGGELLELGFGSPSRATANVEAVSTKAKNRSRTIRAMDCDFVMLVVAERKIVPRALVGLLSDKGQSPRTAANSEGKELQFQNFRSLVMIDK